MILMSKLKISYTVVLIVQIHGGLGYLLPEVKQNRFFSSFRPLDFRIYPLDWD